MIQKHPRVQDAYILSPHPMLADKTRLLIIHNQTQQYGKLNQKTGERHGAWVGLSFTVEFFNHVDCLPEQSIGYKRYGQMIAGMHSFVDSRQTIQDPAFPGDLTKTIPNPMMGREVPMSAPTFDAQGGIIAPAARPTYAMPEYNFIRLMQDQAGLSTQDLVENNISAADARGKFNTEEFFRSENFLIRE